MFELRQSIWVKDKLLLVFSYLCIQMPVILYIIMHIYDITYRHLHLHKELNQIPNCTPVDVYI